MGGPAVIAGDVMTRLRERAQIDAVVERLDVFTPPKNWMDGAPCIGKPDAMFFPEGRGRDALAREGAAICSACHLRAVCLIAALQAEQHLDVDDVTGRRWLSGKQRRQILADRSGNTSPVPDRHDDTALMLALCARIDRNLNQENHQP